jgi:3-deoxy-manno-octulosonate cytidylyltransferase (CMP-KDO synthetase)
LASVLGVIPVRLASTRFPEKALASLNGRPLVHHVYRRAQQAKSLDRLIVATDHPRIAQAVRDFGGEVFLTQQEHATGSDRVWEVASTLDFDQIVNIQGDQPRVDPACIDACVAALSEEGVDMATAAAPLKDLNAPPDVVRVVTDPQNFAVCFSRHSQPDLGVNWRHLGIYAFQRSTLKDFAGRAQAPDEIRKGLEQLRVLAYGGKVKVVFVASAAPAVDRREDLQSVLAWKS